jgi:hypothetical protein
VAGAWFHRSEGLISTSRDCFAQGHAQFQPKAADRFDDATTINSCSNKDCIENKLSLGPVDGFHQNQSASKRHESSETFGRFLATHCDPLEPFELTDGLLNAGAPSVEQLQEVFRPVLCGRTIRDQRDNAALAALIGVTTARGVVSDPMSSEVGTCVVSWTRRRSNGRRSADRRSRF